MALRGRFEQSVAGACGPMNNPARSFSRLATRIPGLLAVAAFLLLTILHATGLDGAYRHILAFFGMLEPTPAFLDTQALLAAVECHAAGIDVMQGNPCDIQNRPHVYGFLWLWLTALRLDRTMTAPIGIGLDLLFLAGLFALPKARR